MAIMTAQSIAKVFSELIPGKKLVNGIRDSWARYAERTGTTLEAHCGPKNSRLTAQLPLIVPPAGGLPKGAAGLRVGGPPNEEGEFEWRLWEEYWAHREAEEHHEVQITVKFQ